MVLRPPAGPHGRHDQRALPAHRARVRRRPAHQRGDGRPRAASRATRTTDDHRALLARGAAARDAAPRRGPRRARRGGRALPGPRRRRVDLNMGCPVPKIAGKGKGAALMRDVAAAVILRAMRKAVSVPLHRQDPRRLGRRAPERGRGRAAWRRRRAWTPSPCTRARARSCFTGRAPWDDHPERGGRRSRCPVTGNGDVRSDGGGATRWSRRPAAPRS